MLLCIVGGHLGVSKAICSRFWLQPQLYLTDAACTSSRSFSIWSYFGGCPVNAVWFTAKSARCPSLLSHTGVVFAACVCPRSKRKTAWAINTNLATRILYNSCSASIDPEVKRSEVKVTRLRKPSRSHGCIVKCAAAAVCCCCRRAWDAHVLWLLWFLF